MIGKVSGVLTEYRGQHGRIQVLSYKDNGKIIVDKQEIKEAFPPHGFVFAPRFVENFDYGINTLLEFGVSSTTSSIGDSILMDTNNCKKIGVEVFSITENVFEGELSIDQPKLKSFIRTESSNFYIKNNGFLFGPFKYSSGEILPKLGKEVNKYKSTGIEISVDEKSYLLAEPMGSLGKVDCMTPKQLSEWMQGQIQNLEVKTNLNALQKALQSQELKELDEARMVRVLKNVDHVLLNLKELKKLSTASSHFQNLFDKQIGILKNELKQELVQPVENQKGELEREVAALEKAIRKAEKNKHELLIEVNKLTEEYKSISNQKDRLIEDIKIHTLVGTERKEERGSLVTFEEQIFINDGNSYKDLSDFLSTVNNNIENIDVIDKRYIFNCFNQLSQSKLILTDNIGAILQIARLSNNCKLFIQQVEANWIKFESFYENGLKQIWVSAHKNENQIHFLFLEDINMASIECYGRPVLDIVAGIRRKIPGLLLEWPRNLWIFACPLIEFEEHNFGLPLLKKTFERCGAFPRNEIEIQFKNVVPIKVLQVDYLLNSDILPPNYLNEYFRSQ